MPFPTSLHPNTTLFCHSYPYSAISFGSEPAYGAFKSLSASALECCAPGSTFPVVGAKVVKVSQNREDFLHLNEIEIIDINGNNVALDGTCFSKNRGYGGDPGCLNDGVVGIYPDTCNSHSLWTDAGNYDYCVLDQAVDIQSVKIYPFLDPAETWKTGRMNDLQLEVYAEVSGESETATFIGLLASYGLKDVFTSTKTGPHEKTSEYIKCHIYIYDCIITLTCI